MATTDAARTDAFRAIADPTRRALMKRLAAGEARVSDLCEGHALTFAAVSKHLGVLRRARLVRTRRVGRERLYRLDPRPLREVVGWLRFFEAFWEDKLDALE